MKKWSGKQCSLITRTYRNYFLYVVKNLYFFLKLDFYNVDLWNATPWHRIELLRLFFGILLILSPRRHYKNFKTTFSKADYRWFARSPRDTKNMWDTTHVYGLFCVVYAASWDRFLMSHISNHPAVEVVIMHETKGFSRAIRDKI